MDRRNFLTNTGAALGAALISPRHLFAGQGQVNETVERVHVIFKTHLDIGFTDLASNVVKTYFDKFIPGVLSLTENIRKENKSDRYTWTTGSWLIYRYLEEASPDDRRRMEQAIERGDFFWHGLPFTTHTELMDQSLLKLATSYSASLDRRFGRKTLAAKMTDVPGHTRGMIPAMAEAGIELLHVGMNDSSAVPDVPPLFTWKSPDGTELTVMCQSGYGGVLVLPGGKTAVSISFTQDNLGPHTPEQIAGIYSKLRAQFPKAKVFASDMNSLAREVSSLRAHLPVVTGEIGDTWMQGTGSDPLMIARFRELSRLRQDWISTGKLAANGDIDMAFGKHFLCIPEHTWGLAIRFLKRSPVYNMDDFRVARKSPEFKLQEKSWEDKRAFLTDAIHSLPPALAVEANLRIKSLVPLRTSPNKMNETASGGAVKKTRHFRIGFDAKTGAICHLEHLKTGRQWAGAQQLLGLFSYQTFSQTDYDRWMEQYVNPEIRHLDWVIDNRTKRGLDKSNAKSALYLPVLKKSWREKRDGGEFFLSLLEVPGTGDSGCPREIMLETFLPGDKAEVQFTLKWFKKEASRLPEAMWFSFTPVVDANDQWEMDKMGQKISPRDVVKNGNRNQHGIISGVSCRSGKNSLELGALDAFLVSPGRRSLLTFDNRQPDPTGGMHFNLYNNVVNTNWRQWFDDDMQFRFTLSFG